MGRGRGQEGGRGVILSHTTFFRQNGVACTRPKKNDDKKRFCCRSFPFAVVGVGGLGGRCFQHKLDEENFDISNHQKFMRHKMGLKRKGEGGELYPCLEDGRQMKDETRA